MILSQWLCGSCGGRYAAIESHSEDTDTVEDKLLSRYNKTIKSQASKVGTSAEAVLKVRRSRSINKV
jgi:hypothetical protein